MALQIFSEIKNWMFSWIENDPESIGAVSGGGARSIVIFVGYKGLMGSSLGPVGFAAASAATAVLVTFEYIANSHRVLLDPTEGSIDERSTHVDRLNASAQIIENQQESEAKLIARLVYTNNLLDHFADVLILARSMAATHVKTINTLSITPEITGNLANSLVIIKDEATRLETELNRKLVERNSKEEEDSHI